MKYAITATPEELAKLDVLMIDIESALDVYISKNKDGGGSRILLGALENVKEARQILQIK